MTVTTNSPDRIRREALCDFFLTLTPVPSHHHGRVQVPGGQPLILRVRDSCVRLGTRRRCGSRAILAVETLLPRKPAGARFRALPTSPGQRLSGRIRRGARRTHRYPRRFHRSARSSHPNLPETRADLVRALASARDIRATLRLTETFAMSATALSLGAVPGTALRRSDSRRRYKMTFRRAVRVSAAIAQPVAGKVSVRPRDPAPAPLRMLSTPRHVPTVDER